MLPPFLGYLNLVHVDNKVMKGRKFVDSVGTLQVLWTMWHAVNSSSQVTPVNISIISSQMKMDAAHVLRNYGTVYPIKCNNIFRMHPNVINHITN